MTEQPKNAAKARQVEAMGHPGMSISSGGGSPQTIRARRLPAAIERRRAAARAALAEMKNPQDPVVRIDDKLLDFLAEEISDQMMQEVARRWRASNIGFPTVLKLVTLAETIHLQVAVATLDQ